MRYVKLIAQDHGGNQRPDTVLVQFYQKDPCEPDLLLEEAIAVDVTADAVVDLAFSRVADEHEPRPLFEGDRIKPLADAFLALRWFNEGASVRRSLVVYVQHFNRTTKAPNAIRLQFHERPDGARAGKQTLLYSASAYDGDGDGTPDSFTRTDVDGDGIASHADRELVRQVVNAFLELKWYE